MRSRRVKTPSDWLRVLPALQSKSLLCLCRPPKLFLQRTRLILVPSYSRFLRSEIIEIEVGPDKTEFGVHSSVLQSTCSYFQGALNENFIEGKNGKVPLPDESVDTVGNFVGWMYGCPPVDKNTKQWTLDTDALAELYVFGDRFGVPSMKIDVLHQMKSRFAHWAASDQCKAGLADGDLPEKTIAFLWENVPEKDPARKLIRDSLVYYLRTFKINLSVGLSKLSALPSELLASVAICSHNSDQSKKPRLPGYLQNECCYLEHAPCR